MASKIIFFLSNLWKEFPRNFQNFAFPATLCSQRNLSKKASSTSNTKSKKSRCVGFISSSKKHPLKDGALPFVLKMVSLLTSLPKITVFFSTQCLTQSSLCWKKKQFSLFITPKAHKSQFFPWLYVVWREEKGLFKILFKFITAEEEVR